MAAVLTGSLEDYLEVIAGLIKVKGHAHVKDIAEKLNVKMPSVTGALQQLARQGYVIYSAHQPVQLTDAGKAAAAKVIKKHEILEKFLSDILNLPPDKSTHIACKVEHVIDEDVIDKLSLFSQAIASRADATGLKVHLTEAMDHLSSPDKKKYRTLSSLDKGVCARICYFSRNLKLPPESLKVDDEFLFESFSLDKSAVIIVKGNQRIPIPAASAENIWVTVTDSMPK